MGQDSESVVRAIFRSINDRDVELGASLVADDCEYLDVPTGQIWTGPEGWREQFNWWIGAFPDGKVEITNLIASGEWVAVEYTGRGTNSGPILTPGGQISPTGRSAEMRFAEIVQVRNGKLVGGRAYWDTGAFTSQLGITLEALAGAAV